ncbi:MAG: radical SAM protein, partial [Proteobacteria bacterium]|nr:radical SAM protein [Pseudomonadota bacterium]
MKPFVIPFFLPQQGCPHRCLYCNQHRSGGRRAEPLSPPAVTRGLETGLNSPRRRPEAPVEAAFFGGTFTALPRERQAALLGACAPFLESGRLQGVRLSTRPDALSDEEIAFLGR